MYSQPFSYRRYNIAKIFSLRCFITALFPLFLFSCSNRNQVKIVDTNFKGEIEEQQNLVFQFNKDLYPDSILNNWDSTDYIDFEPKVAGAFRWNQTNELVFSPQAGFQPGTVYTARLTTHLLSNSKKKHYQLGGKQTLTFHTAPLKVTNAHTQWTRGIEAANVAVQLDLEFNYPTDITQAASKLRLRCGGHPVMFNAVSSGIGKTLSVQFQPLNDKDENVDLSVALDKGIAIAGSKVSSKNDTAFITEIASRYTLKVTHTDAKHDGVQGIVTLSLSQPVTEDGLKGLIKIDPSVNFKAEATDEGIRVTSNDFDPKVNYNITISSALQGGYGGRLKEDYTDQISFGELEPALHFINQKGMYLSSKGYRNLALNIVEVSKVNVTVVKVYENNLLQLLRKGTSWGYDDSDDDDYHEYEYYATGDLGDTVFQKTYEVDKLPKNNASHLLHLDFEDKLRGYNGVYIICVASAEQRWVQESKILSLSDIGLIVKQEDNKLLVFANSIRNATPVSDAKITFISTTNQPVYTTTTDKDGVAVLDDIKSKAPGFRIGMVSAKSGDDYSFITFNESRIETSRFDIGGRTVNATGLNAWIYAERNLYRPGESIHASLVVRDEGWMPPGEMPVKLRLLMPNGKEFSTQRKTLNAQGSTEVTYSIPPTALTGTYTLQAYSGNDVLLNTYNFSIEDFMPDRIKVDLKLDKEQAVTGETLTALIQADNLFGTPAANRNYEWELNIDKGKFQPEGYDDYNFDVVKDFSFPTDFRSGVTGQTGNAKEQFTLSNDMAETGLLKGNIRATVFDETGRPVHRYVHFDVYSQPVFIGIKNFNDYVGIRVPVKINLIAVDKDGAQHAQKATVTMIRKEWQNVIEQDGSRYKYVSKWTEKTLSTQNINISGSSTLFSFTPELSGEYEIRVAREGSTSYVSQTFYAYGMGNTQYSSFEVNNEGNVTIKADKAAYAPGDNINLLFTTPFEGRMLVSIERDHVIEYYFVNTNNKSASLKIKATDAYLPNVYVSATLFRAMDGSDMPLTVAHGYKNIQVAARQNKLPLTVTMKEQSRSKTKQVISVKTAPNAYVTIAAVDEGILQVKNYKTPDPYAYFYQKVALAVNSFDIYPLLLPEYKITQSSTGGDAGADEEAGRVNPLFVNRVKNVSFWSGIIQADRNGNARYEIEVPQFSGDIRVMAVAYKDKAFGSFDNHMKVTDPVIISTALPRFFSPGDKALMPVTLSNTTGKVATVQVTASVQGAVAIQGTQTQNITIKPNSEARVVFNIAAASQIGTGKVLISAKALGETFTDETEIAVRPPASLQKDFVSGIIESGKTTTINLNNKFIPGTFEGTLVLAKSPLVQFSKNLDYLIQYPYGCVEQTTAAAFPQLYYADLTRALNGKTGNDINPNYNVQQAILKLQSMQLPNGSLSYWPGGETESWWGSTFAAHFLIEAQRAGFDVNEATLDRLLEYLKFRLKKKEVIEYYFNGNQRKTIAAKEVPYSLYVLALAHQPQQSMMNYYKGNLSSLSLDGKYLLAAAYTLGGEPEKAKQVLPPAFSGEKSETAFGGSFYSFARDKAIALSALLDVNPNSPQVATLSRMVSDELRHNTYLNTQENVFGILAMGKIAKRAAATNAAASIIANGKTIASTQGAPITVDLKAFLNQSLQVDVKGKGAYYFFREISGISSDGSIREEDKNLKVRRYFYNREGQQIKNNTFRQNDLIVVKLTIEGQYRSQIDNVVITDMLPAGFEIENTRLNEMPNLKWVTEAKDRDEPDYMDVRDDRLNLFTSTDSKQKTFYYMVRAVSPGVYKLGPVQADAMYNGMYHSYNGAGVVKILE